MVPIDDPGRPPPLDAEGVAAALADAYDRRLLAACVRRPRSVKDLSAATGLPLATTYRHVNRLVEAGLVVLERSAFTPDGKRFELYRSRLRSARIEFDAAGEHVSWEANEPVEARLVDMWDALKGRPGW